MSAHNIAASLGEARREGRGWRCRCPQHGGRSLVLRDGDAGRLLVTCWGGCDRLEVLSELRKLGLLDAIDQGPLDPAVLSRPFDLASKDDSRRRAIRIWDAAQSAPGSPLEHYLANRGLSGPPPATLRWSPRCWHGGLRQELPAMIALVEHVRDGVVGIHRTYLTRDGSAKADLTKNLQKRALGPVGGGAVRLGKPQRGEWLAVAEGIETTLAVMTACAIPGWAALSAGGIRTLILPAEVTHIIICADHDANDVGQRAAREAARRFLAEGRGVRVAIPPGPGTDFNDLLLGRDSNRLEVEHDDVAA
jgi:putative DNA primase/helicase